MNQLLQNLMVIAIKYRVIDPPKADDSAINKGNRWLFSVLDNEVSVVSNISARLFQMFQRGYTQEERPGTGIGSAISRKIVGRHNGHIWVKSEEER
jgi:light-regulated signal transduction histidine kinase (bacteriophytochrome)